MDVFVVGDELVAGFGDPKALGWTGRVAARTLAVDDSIRFHSLGVPRETTGELAERWDAEVLRRIGGYQGDGGEAAVVVAIGRHDIYQDVSSPMTRLALANILDRAKALGMRTMVAGPPPGGAADQDAIAQLAAVCRESAERRAVPYVDLFGPLAAHEQWLADLALGRGDLPGQAGYGLMAWLVLQSGWHEWLGIPASAGV